MIDFKMRDKMKKILMSLVSVLIAFSATAFAAEKALDLAEYASYTELASAVTEYFFGDRVGGIAPSSKKIRLGIIPVKIVRSENIAGLVRALTETGKFEILDLKESTAFIQNKKINDPAFVREMRKTYNLDAVLSVRTVNADGKMLFITRMFSTDQAKSDNLFTAFLDQQKGPVDVSTSAASAGISGVAKSLPVLPFAVQLFAVADLDSDGVLEYVFSDGHKIHIYRQEPTGWRRIWTDPDSSDLTKNLHMEVADINGTGRPQIFVTLMLKGKVSSAVYEEHQGTYRRIAVLPGFARILTYPGRGALLLVQTFDEKRFFGGTPRQYTWSGKEYTAGTEFPLPKNVILYGFEVADFGEAQPLLVSLEDKNHIRVYSRETFVWESRERYGGTDIIAIESGTDTYNTQLQVAIKGRFYICDVDGDGREELLVPKNIGGTVFAAPHEAEIDALEWTGARFEHKLSLKNVPGAILDFQIVPHSGKDMEIFVLIQPKGGAFSKALPRMVAYSVH